MSIGNLSIKKSEREQIVHLIFLAKSGEVGVEPSNYVVGLRCHGAGLIKNHVYEHVLFSFAMVLRHWVTPVWRRSLTERSGFPPSAQNRMQRIRYRSGSCVHCTGHPDTALRYQDGRRIRCWSFLPGSFSSKPIGPRWSAPCTP